MSATGTPLPMDMNAFIAGQMYQAMLMSTPMMRWQYSSPHPQLVQAPQHNFNYNPSLGLFPTPQVTPFQNGTQNSFVSSSLGVNGNAGQTAQAKFMNAAEERNAPDTRGETSPDQSQKTSHRQNVAEGNEKNNEAKIERIPLSANTNDKNHRKLLIVIDAEEDPLCKGKCKGKDDMQNGRTSKISNNLFASDRKRRSERELESIGPQSLELQLLEELRIKAMSLKKKLLRRFKEEQMSFRSKRTKIKKEPCEQHSSGARGRSPEQCGYPNCSYRTTRRSHLVFHIATHYPDVYFCPVCCSTFSRADVFVRHFQRGLIGKDVARKQREKQKQGDHRRKDSHQENDYVVPCVESEEALRFEVGRDKERFNFYYLGVMEDYEMSDEHFEILAGRRRGDMEW